VFGTIVARTGVTDGILGHKEAVLGLGEFLPTRVFLERDQTIVVILPCSVMLAQVAVGHELVDLAHTGLSVLVYTRYRFIVLRLDGLLAVVSVPSLRRELLRLLKLAESILVHYLIWKSILSGSRHVLELLQLDVIDRSV